jgi:hypothetical protein
MMMIGKSHNGSLLKEAETFLSIVVPAVNGWATEKRRGY